MTGNNRSGRTGSISFFDKKDYERLRFQILQSSFKIWNPQRTTFKQIIQQASFWWIKTNFLPKCLSRFVNTFFDDDFCISSRVNLQFHHVEDTGGTGVSVSLTRNPGRVCYSVTAKFMTISVNITQILEQRRHQSGMTTEYELFFKVTTVTLKTQLKIFVSFVLISIDKTYTFDLPPLKVSDRMWHTPVTTSWRQPAPMFVV